MRDGTLSVDAIEEKDAKALKREAEYFKLEGLLKILEGDDGGDAVPIKGKSSVLRRWDYAPGREEIYTFEIPKNGFYRFTAAGAKALDGAYKTGGRGTFLSNTLSNLLTAQVLSSQPRSS